jgi:hypothetical protein
VSKDRKLKSLIPQPLESKVKISAIDNLTPKIVDLTPKPNAFDLMPKISTSVSDLMPKISTSAFDLMPKISTSAFDLMPKVSTSAFNLMPKVSASALDLMPKTTSAFDNIKLKIPTSSFNNLMPKLYTGTFDNLQLIVNTDINSGSIFKNLIIPKETIEKAYPSFHFENHNIKSILTGISPSKYAIESNLLKEKKTIDSFLVVNDTNEKIPIKSMVSTVSSIDLLSNISKDEVLLFYNHLSQYPMLGLEHEVGRKIFDEVDNIKVRTIKNNILYRVRLRNPKERAIPYSTEEMFSAPFGVTGIGRYNSQGQGELYTCDNKDVAIRECLKDHDLSFDIVELKLKTSVDLIDLTDKSTPLVQYCSFSMQTSSGLEYLVPTFIAQCAKMKGITGLIFNSTQDDKALNFVFFDYLRSWFTAKHI